MEDKLEEDKLDEDKPEYVKSLLRSLEFENCICERCGADFKEVKGYVGLCGPCEKNLEEITITPIDPKKEVEFFLKGVPKRYRSQQSINISKKEMNSIIAWCEEPQKEILILCSRNLKTLSCLSILVMSNLVNESLVKDAVYCDFNFLKDSYFNKVKGVDRDSFDDSMTKILHKEGLLIEGAGIEDHLTKPSKSLLLRILSSRYNDLKVSVLTVNRSISELSSFFGETISHYVREGVVVYVKD